MSGRAQREAYNNVAWRGSAGQRDGGIRGRGAATAGPDAEGPRAISPPGVLAHPFECFPFPTRTHRELHAVDRLAASAVARREVATLQHEVRNAAVESAALVVQWLARLADALLARAEGAEVLSGLRS